MPVAGPVPMPETRGGARRGLVLVLLLLALLAFCAGASPLEPSATSAPPGTWMIAAADDAEALRVFTASDAAVLLPATRHVVALAGSAAAADAAAGDLETALLAALPGLLEGAHGPFVLKVPERRRALSPPPVPPPATGTDPLAAVFLEDFEQGLSRWTLANDTGGAYEFGTFACETRSGLWAADPVRSGFMGQHLTCWDSYPPSVTTQITHTSCEEVAGAAQAWLDFWLASSMTADDRIGVYYDGGDGYIYGYGFVSTWSPMTHLVLNLKQWTALGDLTALPCPRVIVQFRSRGTPSGSGAAVDDLAITTGAAPFLSASARANPASGPAPLAVAFDVDVAGSAGGDQFQWLLGDAAGSTATTKQTTFTYTEPGDYWVRARVMDASGARAYAHTKVTVTTAPACALSCSASVPPGATAGSPVTFTASSTATSCAGSPAYEWAFGDGRTSAQQSPVQSFPAGTYAWTLTVRQAGASCVRTGTLTVTAPPQQGLPGDCDGDGAVAPHELQRAINMLLGKEDAGCGADRNGDGKVSEGELLDVVDAALARGPETPRTTVATATVGPAGGSLEGGGLALRIPPGALAASVHLSVHRELSPAAEPGRVSDVYLLDGLPDGLGADLTLEITLPSAPPLAAGESLVVSAGWPVFVKSGQVSRMGTGLVPATLSGNRVTAVLPRPLSPSAASGSPAPLLGLPDDLQRATSETRQVSVRTLRKVTSAAGRFFTYAYADREARARQVLAVAEAALTKLESLGFSLACRVDARSGFRPIEIQLKDLGSKLGNYVASKFGADPCGNAYYFTDYLEVTDTEDPSGPLFRRALAHELFHLVQAAYDSSRGLSNLWISEASSTWFEKVFEPGGCPDVQSAHQTFTWSGLLNPAKFEPGGFFEPYPKLTEKHGYGAATFVEWLVARGGTDAVSVLWDNRRLGNGEVPALQAAAGEDLLVFVRQFEEDLLTETFVPCGVAARDSLRFFGKGKVADKGGQEIALPRSFSFLLYPFTAFTVTLLARSDFDPDDPYPVPIEAAGLVEDQEVVVYERATRRELARLTKDRQTFEVADLRDHKATQGILLLVRDLSRPAGLSPSDQPQSARSTLLLTIGKGLRKISLGGTDLELLCGETDCGGCRAYHHGQDDDGQAKVLGPLTWDASGKRFTLLLPGVGSLADIGGTLSADRSTLERYRFHYWFIDLLVEGLPLDRSLSQPPKKYVYRAEGQDLAQYVKRFTSDGFFICSYKFSGIDFTKPARLQLTLEE